MNQTTLDQPQTYTLNELLSNEPDTKYWKNIPNEWKGNPVTISNGKVHYVVEIKRDNEPAKNRQLFQNAVEKVITLEKTLKEIGIYTNPNYELLSNENKIIAEYSAN